MCSSWLLQSLCLSSIRLNTLSPAHIGQLPHQLLPGLVDCVQLPHLVPQLLEPTPPTRVGSSRSTPSWWATSPCNSIKIQSLNTSKRLVAMFWKIKTHCETIWKQDLSYSWNQNYIIIHHLFRFCNSNFNICECAHHYTTTHLSDHVELWRQNLPKLKTIFPERGEQLPRLYCGLIFASK